MTNMNALKNSKKNYMKQIFKKFFGIKKAYPIDLRLKEFDANYKQHISEIKGSVAKIKDDAIYTLSTQISCLTKENENAHDINKLQGRIHSFYSEFQLLKSEHSVTDRNLKIRIGNLEDCFSIIRNDLNSLRKEVNSLKNKTASKSTKNRSKKIEKNKNNS